MTGACVTKWLRSQISVHKLTSLWLHLHPVPTSSVNVWTQLSTYAEVYMTTGPFTITVQALSIKSTYSQDKKGN